MADVFPKIICGIEELLDFKGNARPFRCQRSEFEGNLLSMAFPSKAKPGRQ
jgi:hypothetical protein